MKTKKNYEEAELEIIRLNGSNVIATSDCDDGFSPGTQTGGDVKDAGNDD